MLDLKLIRSDPERVKTALARRGAADGVDELLALDARRRTLLPEIENAQAERKNALRADRRGQAARRGRPRRWSGGSRPEGDDRDRRRRAERGRGRTATEIALTLPNLPDPTPRTVSTEEDAVTLRKVGEPPSFDFEPRDHLEIGTALGLIDMEAGARVSGTRFAYLKGDLVLLELALVRYAIELVRAKRATSRWCRRSWSGRRRWWAPVSCPATATRSTRCPRTTSSWSAPSRSRSPTARRPDPRRRRPAAALCGFLDLLPPRGRCRRPRHAGDLPRPPVRQGRDVLVRRALESADEHERLLAIEERILTELDSLPGRLRRGGRPRRPGGQEVRLRGLDPEPRTLSRADLLLEHNRLSGPAPQS